MTVLFIGLPLLVIRLVVFASTVTGEETVLCKQNYYVDRYSRAIISCEYDASFYTVRWYFDDSERSFLLIDGGTKSGNGYESGDYDITQNGDMIINRADANHDGKYKIIVLDKGGLGTSKTMMVFVTVPLNTLTIMDCDSSQSELCIKDEVQTTFLVCDAKDVWPAVKLQWLEISQHGSTPIPANTTTTFNQSSLLFRSTSTLEYFPELFAYQYFTCVATGTAAYKVSNNSIIIEGRIPSHNMPPGDVHVLQGSDLELPCPLEDLPFGQLQVMFRNGTNKLIKIINSYCLNVSTCTESESTVTTIADVNYENEGSYQCISSNGVMATKLVTDVTVIISLGTSSTVFGGCVDAKGCSQPLFTSGSVNCSVSGMRPPVKLSMEVDDESKDLLTLNFKDEIFLQDDSTGTSTTTITFEYEVPECTESVKLKCVPEPDEYMRLIQESTLQLKAAEVDTCSTNGSGSVVVVVIIVIIVIIVIGVVVGVIIYKKKDSKTENENKQMETPEELEPLNKNDKDEAQHINEKHQGKEKQAPKKADKKFQDLMREYLIKHEDSEANDKDLQTLLTDFHSKQKVDPVPLLKLFLETESINNKTTLYVVKQFATCKRSDWLSSAKVLELLDFALKNQELSFTRRIKMVQEMFALQTVNMNEYALETMNNFEDHKGDFTDILNKLSKNEATATDDVIKSVFKYLAEYLTKQDNDPNKVDNREYFLTSISALDDDAMVMRYLLLLYAEIGTDDVGKTIDILQDTIDTESVHEYYGRIKKEKWLSKKTLIEFLRGIKGKNTVEKFVIQLSSLVIDGKLQSDTFVDALKSSLDGGLVSEDCLKSQISGWITTLPEEVRMEVINEALEKELVDAKTFIQAIVEKRSNVDGVKLLLYILKTKRESSITTSGILGGVIKHYQIKPGEMISILDKLETPEDEQKSFFANEEVHESLFDEEYNEKLDKDVWMKLVRLIPIENKKFMRKATNVVLEGIVNCKLSPTELDNILDNIQYPNDERLAVLKNAKVAELFLKQKLDDKGDKAESWLKFLCLTPNENPEATKEIRDKFLDVIKKFKVKLADILVTLNNLQIPLVEKNNILTSKEVVLKLLGNEDKDIQKCNVQDWKELFNELAKQMEVLDSGAEAFFSEVIKKFKLTSNDLETMLEKLQVPEEEKVAIITNKKIKKSFKKPKAEKGNDPKASEGGKENETTSVEGNGKGECDDNREENLDDIGREEQNRHAVEEDHTSGDDDTLNDTQIEDDKGNAKTQK
ncbi:uncharacterized protein [Apostichopus japonicus]|uniref:uncharacterized protein isoform X3 n=1 Tax=Stichopus japonicus TaxID=307972 RepID=UPI003AB4A7A3